MPGANRACAGHQSAAGPAVQAGEHGASRGQGEGATGPVQHPHRRTGHQLMNSHHHATRTQLMTVCLRTGARGGLSCQYHVKVPHDVTIYEHLENKKFLVFLLFVCPIHTHLGVLSPFCMGHI